MKIYHKKIELFLWFSLLMLASCNEEESVKTYADGEIAAVVFNVSESFAEESQTRATLPNDTVMRILEDGNILEAVLEPEYGKEISENSLTRSTTTTSAKALACVYRGTDLYKYEQTTITNGSMTIHVPSGETFGLIVYAHCGTDATQPVFKFTGTTTVSPEGGEAVTGDGTLTVEEDGTQDVMIAKTSIRISSTERQSITFDHKFSQVRLKVKNNTDASLAPGNIVTFNANLSEGVKKNKCTGTITHTGVTFADTTTPLTNASFAISNGTSTESAATDYKNVMANGNNLKVTFNSLKVGGKTYTNQTISFNNKLNDNTKYTITAKIKQPSYKVYFTVTHGEINLGLGALYDNDKGQMVSDNYTTIKAESSVTSMKVGILESLTTFTGWYDGTMRIGNNNETEQNSDVWIDSTDPYILHVKHTSGTNGKTYTARFTKWADGNLHYNDDGTYSFASAQETINTNDYSYYFPYNSLLPSDNTIHSSYSEERDPCRKVSPAGSWKTPTMDDLRGLVKEGCTGIQTRNGVSGMYIGTKTVPNPNSANWNKFLFLPAGGMREYRFNEGTWEMKYTDWGYYWCASEPETESGSKYCGELQWGPGYKAPAIEFYGYQGNKFTIRCVTVQQ